MVNKNALKYKNAKVDPPLPDFGPVPMYMREASSSPPSWRGCGSSARPHSFLVDRLEVGNSTQQVSFEKVRDSVRINHNLENKEEAALYHLHNTVCQGRWSNLQECMMMVEQATKIKGRKNRLLEPLNLSGEDKNFPN